MFWNYPIPNTVCPAWVSSAIKFNFQSMFLHLLEIVYINMSVLRLQVSFFPPKIGFYCVMGKEYSSVHLKTYGLLSLGFECE
jgi:hypothetical protein